MNKKEISERMDMFRILAGVFLVLFLIVGIAFVSVVVQRDECRTEIDTIGLKEEKWECPMLLEKGEYSFDSHNGILESPSGKELECKKDFIDKSYQNDSECYSENCYWDIEENLISGCTMSKVNCKEFEDKFALSLEGGENGN